MRPGLLKEEDGAPPHSSKGLLPDERDEIRVELVQHAIVLEPNAATLRAPDPGDQPLWGLLAARDDLRLATGERRLLRDAGMRGRVIPPREFVEGDQAPGRGLRT